MRKYLNLFKIRSKFKMQKCSPCNTLVLYLELMNQIQNQIPLKEEEVK